MKTQKNSGTLLVIFGLWLGLILGCSSLRKATNAKRAEREGPPITISAEDLYKAYESDEAAADKLYQGRILIVTGKVGDTQTPEIGNPAVTLIGAATKKGAVQCLGFAADQKDAVSNLEIGQTVTVKGKCMGKVVTNIPVLEDSVIQ